MSGKQVVVVETFGARRRWIARVAADGVLAVGATLLVVSLMAIPAVRHITAPAVDEAQTGAVATASPTAARAARRREHMARLPRWREIRREARQAGTPPAGSARPDSARCPAACASATSPRRPARDD
jgi:hypothetical protein